MTDVGPLHMVSALVENKPGVLHSITNLIHRRGFNIETISAGESEQEGLVRICISMRGDERTLEQIVKQLGKLVNMVSVDILDSARTVLRELALVKVETPDTRIRSDVINYTEIFKGHVVDVAHESLVIEITGDAEKVDAFIGLMRSLGIKEIARTGLIALPRGTRSISLEA